MARPGNWAQGKGVRRLRDATSTAPSGDARHQLRDPPDDAVRRAHSHVRGCAVAVALDRGGRGARRTHPAAPAGGRGGGGGGPAGGRGLGGAGAPPPGPGPRARGALGFRGAYAGRGGGAKVGRGTVSPRQYTEG